MKKAFVIVAAVALLMGCSKESKEAQPAAQGAEKGVVKGITLAYIDVDTLITYYDYCIAYSEVLEKKSASIQATLQSRSQQLESDLVTFQKQLQDGTINSQAEYDNAQASLQKKQEQLQNLQESLVAEFNKEQTMYNDALKDSLDSFLGEYNKAHNYTFVLAKQGDNILLADERYDITQDVIKGMNKRYKGAALK